MAPARRDTLLLSQRHLNHYIHHVVAIEMVGMYTPPPILQYIEYSKFGYTPLNANTLPSGFAIASYIQPRDGRFTSTINAGRPAAGHLPT